jgi:hypothetical protein
MSKDKKASIEDMFASKPLVEVAQPRQAVETPKKPTRQQDRTVGRYDMPKWVKAEILAISQNYKAPASGLASLFLKHAIEAYHRGEIEVEPHLTDTDSLKFLYGIDVGDKSEGLLSDNDD